MTLGTNSVQSPLGRFAGRAAPGGRRSQGAVAVESAVVVLLLFVLVIGITDMGRFLFAEHSVATGVQQGARYAMVRGYDYVSYRTAGNPTRFAKTTSADVSTHVKGTVPGLGEATVTTTWEDSDQKANTSVTVSVSVVFDFLLPFLPSRTLSDSAKMVITQ